MREIGGGRVGWMAERGEEENKGEEWLGEWDEGEKRRKGIDVWGSGEYGREETAGMDGLGIEVRERKGSRAEWMREKI